MKKIVKSVLILGLISLFLTGCSSNKVREDIEVYSEEISKLEPKETKAINELNSVIGENYTSDPITYDHVMNTVLPLYSEFIKELEEIQPETEEVSDVHELYIQAVNTQHQAMLKLISALNNQDINEVNESNALFSEGRTKIREYRKELKSLAKEHDLEL